MLTKKIMRSLWIVIEFMYVIVENHPKQVIYLFCIIPLTLCAQVLMISENLFW